jgi:hypothetical protein
MAELLDCMRTTGAVEQPAKCLGPEEKVTAVAQRRNGIDIESRIELEEMVKLDVKASFADVPISPSTSAVASPQETSRDTRHESSSSFQTDTGDYTIAQPAPQSCRQFFFGYYQPSHEQSGEASPLSTGFLPPSGSILGAATDRADSDPINIGDNYPFYTYPETSMMDMSDICSYLIPAWNTIREGEEALQGNSYTV